MAVKVNLGSGDRPLPGFVNVDVLPTARGVDVIADISEHLPFEDSSVSLIYASHLLEHFPHARSVEILSEWRRVLVPGGRLLIAVPDLLLIANVLVSRPGWFMPPHNPWLGAIYGGQKDDWDFHKTGFTEPWLAYQLTLAGFSATERVEKFPEIGIADTSYSPLPFGRNMSLNLRAINGPGPPASLPPTTLIERCLSAVGAGLEIGMRARTYAQSRRALRRLAKTTECQVWRSQ